MTCDWLKLVHHQMSRLTVHSFVVLVQFPLSNDGLCSRMLISSFCTQDIFSPGDWLLLFRVFLFSWPIFLFCIHHGRAVSLEQTIQALLDGPSWPRFCWKLLLLAHLPFIAHSSDRQQAFHPSCLSVAVPFFFLHFIFIYGEYWILSISSSACVSSNSTLCVIGVLISTISGFPMDNALEFDSYEADLGMSLHLPCLFPCLESFVVPVYYAF